MAYIPGPNSPLRKPLVATATSGDKTLGAHAQHQVHLQHMEHLAHLKHFAKQNTTAKKATGGKGSL